MRINYLPLPDGELLDQVQRLEELIEQEGLDRCELRFADLLTIAAACLFSAHRADVGVYEAGIGGRMDAVSLLRPEVLVLTGIQLEHVDLLGPTRRAILSEKLSAADHRSLVICAPLDDKLREQAVTLARRYVASCCAATIFPPPLPCQATISYLNTCWPTFAWPSKPASWRSPT